MARNRYEFIKVEMRLFNDPRYFMLDDFGKLLYLTLIALAKQTHNHIKKDYPAIKAYLRTEQPPSKIRATIKQLCSNFEGLEQNNYNIWFRDWDDRYEYRGVEEEKEKDKEKEKEKDVSSLKKLKPSYKGMDMRKVKGVWFCLPKDGGEWLKYDAPLKDIIWK